MLGAGVAGLAYSLYPILFPGGSLQALMYIGGVIGAGMSQMIERWFDAITAPVSRRVKHYSKLVELRLARSNGTIDDEQADAITEQLQAEYFLGDTTIPIKRGLPPRSGP